MFHEVNSSMPPHISLYNNINNLYIKTLIGGITPKEVYELDIFTLLIYPFFSQYHYLALLYSPCWIYIRNLSKLPWPNNIKVHMVWVLIVYLPFGV